MSASCFFLFTQENTMVKNCSILCIVLALLGCASSSNNASANNNKIKEANTHWVSLPEPNSLVIYGVSSRQRTRKAEIDSARADAARKAALYNGVRVTDDSVQNIGSGFLDYYVSSDTTFEYDQELEKYQDRLTFDPDRDVVTIDDGSVFVRFSYPAVFPGSVNYPRGKGKDGRPEWVSHRPGRTGDFYTGVGFSGRQTRLRDAIAKSYESAIVSIVSQVSASITASDTSAEYSGQSRIREHNIGNLSHFIVLEIWIDPASLAVSTLAVARPGQ